MTTLNDLEDKMFGICEWIGLVGLTWPHQYTKRNPSFFWRVIGFLLTGPWFVLAFIPGMLVFIVIGVCLGTNLHIALLNVWNGPKTSTKN